MIKILLTGGSGLLGTELKKYLRWYDAPSHKELDICDYIPKRRYDLIIHAAACTDVVKAETDRMACFRTNVYGTLNLVEAYPFTPFVYISSEYAHKPVNFYAITKSLGEQVVMTHSNYLIIRTLFKPNPFPFPKAFKDQYTQGDYVDKIAPLIVKLIKNWDRQPRLEYVGTERKTIFELALRTREVEPISIKDIKTVKLPSDYL